jgi:hypothetical protein
MEKWKGGEVRRVRLYFYELYVLFARLKVLTNEKRGGKICIGGNPEIWRRQILADLADSD